ncbi:hypothetical protein ACHQM5_002983 [Ranunculus cassubicifolius]
MTVTKSLNQMFPAMTMQIRLLLLLLWAFDSYVVMRNGGAPLQSEANVDALAVEIDKLVIHTRYGELGVLPL